MTEEHRPAVKKRRDGRSVVNAVLLSIVGIAVAGTVAFATIGSGDEEEEPPAPPVVTYTPPPGVDPACVVPPDDGSKLWVSEDVLEDVASRLESELTDRFGPPGQMPTERLEKGLIGQPVDYAGHRIVVVVDEAKVDPAPLEADLQEIEAPGVPIDVRGGCNSTDEIRRAMETLQKVDWHPDADKTFAYFVDDYTSTVRVETPAGPALDALRERLADLDLMHIVVVTEGMPTL